LLGHLDAVGFDAAPRFLGIDDRGRETLSFLAGEVPSDCRRLVWSDEQLHASARLLRRFHDATAGSVLAADAEVVCHHDFGPWNLVWVSGRQVGIIDFDNAAPGSRLEDLGYAAWKHLSIGHLDLPPREQLRRLALMASAYGLPADDVLLAAIDAAQRPFEPRARS
jgi:aminoglycoside phosphotransferase (APT) family kinase protein